MLDSVNTKNKVVATTAGTTAVNVRALNVRNNRRQAAAVIIIIIASSLWITSLAMLGIASAGLPWCVTLAFASISSVAWLLTRPQIEQFSFLRVQDRKPVSMVESCAGTYLCLSLSLSAWIVYNFIVQPVPTPVKPQIVDIQLLALTDYKDNRQLLSGTKEHESLRKRVSSDVADSQGSLTPSTTSPDPDHRAVQRPSVSSKPIAGQPLNRDLEKQPVSRSPMSGGIRADESSQRAISRNRENTEYLVSTPPVVPKTPNKANTLSKPVPGDNSPLMEEVQPPEMVELVNNDGDESPNVWQAGGHSSGGTGSRSDLAAYLKELNRRIRHSWAPPRGETRSAELMFRIKKTGQLASVKVLHSSGDASSDQAAINAVISAAPYHALPDEYTMNYLDVCYTFNYRVDQLSEVTGGEIR